MKLTKTNSKGFSAVEIVVAVVAVVVVAGLGYFAYANNQSKSGDDNNQANSSAEADDSGITTQEQADAAEADAEKWTTVPATQKGSIKVGAAVCLQSNYRLKIIFIKSGGGNSTYTEHRPVLLYVRNGRRTGQTYGGQSWWNGTVQQKTTTVGNHRASDTLKMLYGGKYGKSIKWSSLRYC